MAPAARRRAAGGPGARSLRANSPARSTAEKVARGTAATAKGARRPVTAVPAPAAAAAPAAHGKLRRPPGMTPPGQRSSGARPTSARAARARGAPSRAKNRPLTTKDRRPASSAARGKSVPQATTAAVPSTTTALRVRTRWRCHHPDGRPLVGYTTAAGRARRRQTRTAGPRITTTTNAASARPTVVAWPKAWTEETAPERVRRVPTRAATLVPRARATVEARIRERCSSTMAAWSRAVAPSQGSRAAFSTGSQAQKPPQPSST